MVREIRKHSTPKYPKIFNLYCWIAMIEVCEPRIVLWIKGHVVDLLRTESSCMNRQIPWISDYGRRC
jgi:hypothetical protein